MNPTHILRPAPRTYLLASLLLLSTIALVPAPAAALNCSVPAPDVQPIVDWTTCHAEHAQREAGKVTVAAKAVVCAHTDVCL